MLHAERKHAKLSASGAERWVNCPGSVALSEGIADRDTQWSLEGTHAHEVLETVLRQSLRIRNSKSSTGRTADIPREMMNHVLEVARFLFREHQKYPGSEFLVEDRVHLDFISPDMGGTFDAAVVDHFGVLNVYDFKYGAGHPVMPTKNLQAVVYGLGLARLFDWNFKLVRLWIIQPRILGFSGPVFWQISMRELLDYIPVFQRAVKRIEQQPKSFREGDYCFFCKAKGICPLKQQSKIEQGKAIFSKKAKE